MTEADIHALYQSFNDRDAEAVLNHMDPAIDWPNGWEGGRVAGRDAVADYWHRQWSEIDPKVYPESVAITENTCWVVVHQIVKSHQGEVLSDSKVTHQYTLHNGLITRMDITEE